MADFNQWFANTFPTYPGVSGSTQSIYNLNPTLQGQQLQPYAANNAAVSQGYKPDPTPSPLSTPMNIQQNYPQIPINNGPSVAVLNKQAADQAAEQARIELQQAMNEFDRQSSLGNQQIGSLQSEQTGTLSDINNLRTRSANEAATAKTSAESSTMQAKNKALSTAQDTQKSNRNVLRALGILSSSAAGEMLTKPLTEYSKTSADLGTQLVQRKQQVDQWLMDRNQDFDSQVRQVQDKYASLINNIRSDLRYNGEQRTMAVQAAGNALQQKLTGIQQTAMQYQQAAQQYNTSILGQIAQLQLYQNPQADVSGILSAMLNPGIQKQPTSTAAIYQDPRKNNNTISGY